VPKISLTAYRVIVRRGRLAALRKRRRKVNNVVALTFFTSWFFFAAGYWLMERSGFWPLQVLGMFMWIGTIGVLMEGITEGGRIDDELEQHAKEHETRHRFLLRAVRGEPYVLWLRDFLSERPTMHMGPGGSLITTTRDPAETKLVRPVREVLPVMALSNPSHTEPDPYAERIFVESGTPNGWLNAVVGYACHAALIMICGQWLTRGLLEELDMLRRRGLLSRVYLALTDGARVALQKERPGMLEEIRWSSRLGSRHHPPLNPYARRRYEQDQPPTDPVPPALLEMLRQLPKGPRRRVEVEFALGLYAEALDIIEDSLRHVPPVSDTPLRITVDGLSDDVDSTQSASVSHAMNT
jgi:hypothetical protein